MLPLVPELTPDGFRYVIGVDPGEPAQALVVGSGPVIAGEVRCHADSLLIGGRIEARPRYIDLYLGLNDPQGTLEYGSLSFGYVFAGADGDPIQSAQWPPENVNYLSSDQPYLMAGRVMCDPETAYRLTLWSEDGARWEAEYLLITPAVPPSSDEPGDDE